MLDILAQWAPGRHGPLVGHSFRHLSSFIVSDSLGSLPHSEAITSVPLVMSWSSFGLLVTSWSSLGAMGEFFSAFDPKPTVRPHFVTCSRPHPIPAGAEDPQWGVCGDGRPPGR